MHVFFFPHTILPSRTYATFKTDNLARPVRKVANVDSPVVRAGVATTQNARGDTDVTSQLWEQATQGN